VSAGRSSGGPWYPADVASTPSARHLAALSTDPGRSARRRSPRVRGLDGSRDELDGDNGSADELFVSNAALAMWRLGTRRPPSLSSTAEIASRQPFCSRSRALFKVVAGDTPNLRVMWYVVQERHHRTGFEGVPGSAGVARWKGGYIPRGSSGEVFVLTPDGSGGAADGTQKGVASIFGFVSPPDPFGHARRSPAYRASPQSRPSKTLGLSSGMLETGPRRDQGASGGEPRCSAFHRKRGSRAGRPHMDLTAPRSNGGLAISCIGLLAPSGAGHLPVSSSRWDCRRRTYRL